MTTLASSLDRAQDLDRSRDRRLDHRLDLSEDLPEMPLDLSVVTIESLVARDISAYSERNWRSAPRPLVRAVS